MGHITIIDDKKPDIEGNTYCTQDTFAVTLKGDTNHPQIVICPLGFSQGGISKGYADVEAVTCQTLGTTVSWRMSTLGATLIHEYTHWAKLVSPPLPKETMDVQYCPTGVRELGGKSALKNADSYSWFANEVFWTMECNYKFGDPILADDKDPRDPNICRPLPDS